MLSKYEKAGRWICLLYRTGLYRKELEDLGLINLLERCTKRRNSWRRLLLGDLTKWGARVALLGEVAETGLHSIDGFEPAVRVEEIALYATIGRELLR